MKDKMGGVAMEEFFWIKAKNVLHSGEQFQ